MTARSGSQSTQQSSESLHRIRSHNGYGIDEEQPRRSRVAPSYSQEKDPYEVGWDDGANDPLCPWSFKKVKKWVIVSILCAGSFTVTNISSGYTSTYEQMEAEFGNSRIVSVLGLSLFVLGIAFGPMLFGPLSEFYGRRPIYLVAWVVFVLFLFPGAFGTNIQTILVARFFGGFSGSAFLAVSGGAVGDLFQRHELQAPMVLFSLAPFLGPTAGPLIGGFINYNVDWRWTYYVFLVWTGVLLVAVVFFVPETYHPILLRNKARGLRKRTGDDRWLAPTEKTQRSVIRAIGLSLLRPMQLLVFEPMCLNLCLLSAMLLGILYLFFGAFALVFSTNYGFNLWQIGMTFIPICVGMFIASATDPLIVLVYTGIFTFLVDAYPTYAASALAANAFVRCLFATAFPLFGNQMYHKLGFQWASTLLAFLLLAMMPFPFIFFRYGKQIRKKSRYATTA
ncbi:hypothetical protein LLEC1_05740 [Akanthomyces lecanii]|uniref:Major facilitator superfamily (MFS) profile domain-containing protein n=1 Tax=Cordyceps confragosa TaxID=2714763 RepID=A0A179I986_CORDF|nr:hypothetical protein LLEC1_05740 [Akanthomyces lecanii]